MQVLEIIGNMLSGPWTSVFYNDLAKQNVHIDTMNIVKGVIENRKILPEAPMNILLTSLEHNWQRKVTILYWFQPVMNFYYVTFIIQKLINIR